MVTGGGRGRVSGLAEQMWAKDTILDNNVKMGADKRSVQQHALFSTGNTPTRKYFSSIRRLR